MRDLRGMVVVITGASAGIGAALARSLHKQNASLVLAARRLDKLDALNAELKSEHLVIQADVSKTADCEKIIHQAVDRHRRIDTLVANAGYGLYDTVDRTTPQQMRDIFTTNLFGTTDLIHFATQQMQHQRVEDGYRGQVMIVSSVCGRRSVPYLGAYSATKAAQLSIAEAMRVELMDRKIAVTSVHPIMTRTDFGKTAESTGDIILPKRERDWITQPVEHVARRMIEAMSNPRPEVWPSVISRWLVGIGTLFPSFIDSIMHRYHNNVAHFNRNRPK